MTFENIPQHKDTPSSSDELKKGALEMESKNTEIEKMSRGPERDIEIIHIDMLNNEVAKLEHLTGIPETEIIDTYENLTKELAIKSIDQLLKELDKSMSTEDSESLKDKLDSGNFKTFLNAIETFIPKKLLLATACTLMITTPTWAVDTTASQTEMPSTTDYQMSQQIKSELDHSFEDKDTQTISDIESIEKTTQLMSEANQKAAKIIEDIDGPSALSLVPSFFKKAGIKQLAQKAVIDELADNSQAIIEYINGTTKEPPLLEDKALALFHVYQSLLTEVDKFKNIKASAKIRDDIASKLKLIATKDYTRITKEMS